MPANDPQAYYDVADMIDVDPDVLRRLAEKGLLDEEQMSLLTEQARSDKMANAPMPQATPVGNTMVAPNPLQFAAAGLERGIGNYKSAQQQKQLEALKRRQQQVVLGGGGDAY